MFLKVLGEEMNALKKKDINRKNQIKREKVFQTINKITI